MDFHANHALGLPQRLALVQAIEGGSSLRAAAAALSVAPATAHRWRVAAGEERTSRACLGDRSSRPRRSPRRLSASDEAPIPAVERSARGAQRPARGRGPDQRLDLFDGLVDHRCGLGASVSVALLGASRSSR